MVWNVFDLSTISKPHGCNICTIIFHVATFHFSLLETQQSNCINCHNFVKMHIHIKRWTNLFGSFGREDSDQSDRISRYITREGTRSHVSTKLRCVGSNNSFLLLFNWIEEEPVRSFTRISRNRSRVKHITMRPSSEPRAECLYRTLQVASWEYILVDVSWVSPRDREDPVTSSNGAYRLF